MSAGKDHCDVCGAPTPEEFARIKLDDGRFICERCNSTAIITTQEAIEILKDISDYLQAKFNIFVTHSAPITLANRDILKSKAKNKIEGDANKLFGLFVRKGDQL